MSGVQEGNVSEKEQAAALKLLAEMVKVMEVRGARNAEEHSLLVRAKAFLALPVVGPESHGQRRS